MDVINLVDAELREAAEAFSALASNSYLLAEQLGNSAKQAANCLKSGGTLFFAGNGGSFADAQHMAAEFTGKLSRDRQPLSSIVLGANTSSMSAIGNDYGFDQVFAREFEGLRKGEDFVVTFSTSGQSRNIIELAKVAHRTGTPFLGFTGSSPSPLANYGVVVAVPSNRTERIQELHTNLGHVFCLLVEEQLGIFDKA